MHTSKSKWAIWVIALIVGAIAITFIAASLIKPATAQAATKTPCVTKRVNAGAILGDVLQTKFCRWFRYDGTFVREVNPTSVDPYINLAGKSKAMGFSYGSVVYRAGDYTDGHRRHWQTVRYRYWVCRGFLTTCFGKDPAYVTIYWSVYGSGGVRVHSLSYEGPKV